MGFFSRIFGKEQEFDDTVNDSPATPEKPSKAREDFYADLEAQQYTNTKNMLFGQDDIDPAVAQGMVQKIMQNRQWNILYLHCYLLHSWTDSWHYSPISMTSCKKTT